MESISHEISPSTSNGDDFGLIESLPSSISSSPYLMSPKTLPSPDFTDLFEFDDQFQNYSAENHDKFCSNEFDIDMWKSPFQYATYFNTSQPSSMTTLIKLSLHRSNQIEKHELLDMRRVDASIYKKAGRWKLSISLSKNDATWYSRKERVTLSSVKRLSEHLDSAKDDTCIQDIIETLSKVLEDANCVDTEKIQPVKNISGRILSKSLRAEDPVFLRVSRAIYVAARGVVLGGVGEQGRKLAENAWC